VLVVRQKISAGGAALAGGNHVLVAPISIHDENLIALQLVARGLKNDPLAVRRPIRLGVLSAVGKLPDLPKVRACLRWQKLRQPTSCKENV
jgi:hypothetical protein